MSAVGERVEFSLEKDNEDMVEKGKHTGVTKEEQGVCEVGELLGMLITPT